MSSERATPRALALTRMGGPVLLGLLGSLGGCTVGDGTGQAIGALYVKGCKQASSDWGCPGMPKVFDLRSVVLRRRAHRGHQAGRNPKPDRHSPAEIGQDIGGQRCLAVRHRQQLPGGPVRARTILGRGPAHVLPPTARPELAADTHRSQFAHPGLAGPARDLPTGHGGRNRPGWRRGQDRRDRAPCARTVAVLDRAARIRFGRPAGSPSHLPGRFQRADRRPRASTST